MSMLVTSLGAGMVDLLALAQAVTETAGDAASQVAPPTTPATTPEAADLGEAAAGPEAVDFSVYTMFIRATWVVQAVMIMLVLASFWSWAIIFEKWFAFTKMKTQVARFEDDFWSGQPLDDLFDRLGERARSPIERIFVSGMTEWRRSFAKSGGLIANSQQRIDRAMNVAIARESAAINRRLPFLATVGSVSPFIGLFGTVWGIKHSFESIATQQNTNLAVVAPGIAEALLATAIGLLAAIPAVVAYNRLIADAEGLTTGLENFADEFATILGRQIDRNAREEA